MTFGLQAKRALFVSTFLVLSAVSTAEAGFEWKGTAPVAQKPAPVATAPAMPSDMPGLEPVISWDGGSVPTAPVAIGRASSPVAMPANRVDAVEQSVITNAPTPVMPLMQPNIQSADLGEEVSGFGDDLPLVIALQQVVPAGYQFSFASGVNPGVSVSWDGGKPWKTVLSDMLSKQGLGYKIRDNAVVIGYFPTEDVTPVQHVQVSSAPAIAPARQSDAEPVEIRREKPSSFFKKKTESVTSQNDGIQKTPETVDVPAATAPLTAPPVERKTTQVSPVQGSPVIAPFMASHEGVSLPPESNAPRSLLGSIKGGSPVIEETPVPVAAPAAPVVQMASAATAPIAVSAPPQLAEPTWQGAKGQTLRDVLKAWADTSGVELYWSIDYDYRLGGDVNYGGTFDEAVGKLLDQFSGVRPQPYGQLHQSGDSPRVLVIKSYDLTP